MIFNYGVNGDLNNALSINYNKRLLSKELEMDGLTIMSFAMNEVSNSIDKFIIKNKINLKKSYFCLHQPNKTIHNYFLQKFKIDKKNSIFTYKYGNTSAGMIPLSLNEYFSNKKIIYNHFLISGFGSGFLWANVFINMKNIKFLGVKKL